MYPQLLQIQTIEGLLRCTINEKTRFSIHCKILFWKFIEGHRIQSHFGYTTTGGFGHCQTKPNNNQSGITPPPLPEWLNFCSRQCREQIHKHKGWDLCSSMNWRKGFYSKYKNPILFFLIEACETIETSKSSPTEGWATQ